METIRTTEDIALNRVYIQAFTHICSNHFLLTLKENNTPISEIELRVKYGDFYCATRKRL